MIKQISFCFLYVGMDGDIFLVDVGGCYIFWVGVGECGIFFG